MLGTSRTTTLQFGSVNTDDRHQFYIPVKSRKNQTQKHKHQNKQHQQAAKENQNQPFNCSPTSTIQSPELPNAKALAEHADIRVLLEQSVADSPSNLHRFLHSAAPLVPAQYLSKTTMRGWRACDVEFQPYFTLADLWEFFKERSVYGAGVPLVLEGCDNVVQYYVPYLSGIQLYGESSVTSKVNPRRVGEDSDGDSYRDSSSDGSSDYEFAKRVKSSNLSKEIPKRMNGLSLNDDYSPSQEGFSSDDSERGNSQGCLLFEYLERDPPYSREPLADKVLDLSRCYPGLKTLRSCDLLPSSWMAVAWYPIYRIPTGPTLKDLDACFLTYHSLSTSMGGSGNTQSPVVIYPKEADGIPKISLPVFGMASYKFKGSMWTRKGINELKLANSLMQDAGGWLRSQRVNHPDFQFFASHGMYQR